MTLTKLFAVVGAIFTVCIVLCCGVGALIIPPSTTQNRPTVAKSLPAATKNQAAEHPTSQSQRPSVESDPETERIFRERASRYEQELAKWKLASDELAAAEAQKRELESQIAELMMQKPAAPVFESREWSTIDKKYTTIATLVDTDNTNAKLRKVDGAIVSVAKESLSFESRFYIEEAYADLTEYPKRLSEWEAKVSPLTEKLATISQKIQSAQLERPEEPTREAIAAEIAAREAAKEEQKKKDRQAAEKKKAELAAKRAEEELDVDGLVLLRKTVSGSMGSFGGTITGMVENRRSRKLSYVQITFNLYDDSGAQVGSALANVNGLEPGAKWKFEASSFGKEFSSFKFSELTGF